jgi:hypothetical protein
MKKTVNTRLTQFLFCLAVLLFNDFYLKETLHNTFTGKLSDFAGLMIFPWFWSLVFQKNTKIVYWATGFLFVFWKLELSSTTILLINNTIGLNLSRVVDHTDILALTILPVSYHFFERSKHFSSSLKLPIKYGIAGISIFAFIATSAPEIFIEPNWDFNNRYTIPLPKKQVLQERMTSRYDSTIPDSVVLNYDKFRLDYYAGTYRFTFNAEILEKDSLSSELILLKLLNYSIEGVSNEKKDALTRESFLEIFESQVLTQIKSIDLPPLVNYSEIQE